MDSLGDLRCLDPYPPGKVIRYPADKDYTDTELALQWLWDQGCTETWLLGGGGGRLDHSLGIRLLFDRERHPDRWITAHEDVHIIESGTSFSDSSHPGTIVSVFSCGSGPWHAESEGLHWPLNGIEWKMGFFGLSNRAEGTFRIRAVTGNFLVIIPL
jgi:thiamine pyrophosphokinase